MYAASDVCGCVHVVAPSVHMFDAGVMVAVRVVIVVGAAAAIGVWIGVSCGTLAKGCTCGPLVSAVVVAYMWSSWAASVQSDTTDVP